MTLSNSHHITDELLSAYIDGEVTEQERTLVEAALAQDEQIAWRLDSMRQTVTMLRELPEIAMPRTFTLTLDQLDQIDSPQIVESAVKPSIEQPAITAPTTSTRAARAQPTQPATGSTWEQLTEAWRGFWQGGNPILRNAAAVSFALMLLVTSGGQILSRALIQPAGTMVASSESAAPASAAPAAEVVALVPTTESEAATDDTAENGAGDTSVTKVPEANARVMQAPETSPSAEDTANENATESATENAAASPVVESASAAVAEAAPIEDGDVSEQEAVEDAEPAIAAAMVAPTDSAASTAQSAEPPLVAAQPPFPGDPHGRGGGGGEGVGSGGGSGGVPPNAGGAGGGASDSLVPEEAYGFDVDPLGEPTAPPAEESANIEAAPASAARGADVAAESATESATESAAVEGDVETTVEAEIMAEAEEEAEEEAATEQDTAQDSVQDEPAQDEPVSAEDSAETPNTPTPAAVALIAPEPITSSEVVENVPTAGEAIVTSRSADLAIVQIAQGSALLLTIVLSSLWWRSRSPRRRD